MIFLGVESTKYKSISNKNHLMKQNKLLQSQLKLKNLIEKDIKTISKESNLNNLINIESKVIKDSSISNLYTNRSTSSATKLNGNSIKPVFNKDWISKAERFVYEFHRNLVKSSVYNLTNNFSNKNINISSNNYINSNSDVLLPYTSDNFSNVIDRELSRVRDLKNEIKGKEEATSPRKAVNRLGRDLKSIRKMMLGKNDISNKANNNNYNECLFITENTIKSSITGKACNTGNVNNFRYLSFNTAHNDSIENTDNHGINKSHKRKNIYSNKKLSEFIPYKPFTFNKKNAINSESSSKRKNLYKTYTTNPFSFKNDRKNNNNSNLMNNINTNTDVTTDTKKIKIYHDFIIHKNKKKKPTIIKRTNKEIYLGD